MRKETDIMKEQKNTTAKGGTAKSGTAERGGERKTLKTEAERNARVDDLIEKSKKGRLSESELDAAMEEMD